MDSATILSLHQTVVGQPWLATLTIIVANYGVFVLPALLAALWFWPAAHQPIRRRAIIGGCLAACVAVCLGLVLERTLDRPRPFIALGFEPLLPHASDSSFPSDHTLVGVALIGALVLRSSWIGPLLLGWALMVGIARMAAGLHYASDILGSAVLALVISEVAWVSAGWVIKRMPAGFRRHILHV